MKTTKSPSLPIKRGRKHGRTQQKVLLLLMAGVALGLNRSVRRQFKILKDVSAEWREIDRKTLPRTIRRLYESRLIREKHNKDGTVTLVLTDLGKKYALTYNIETITVPHMPVWDKKWRIVLYDVPEKQKSGREILRARLRQIGCLELQRSVFIHPFDCSKEVEYIVEFYNLRKHVRFILADTVDNAPDLKRAFHITDQ